MKYTLQEWVDDHVAPMYKQPLKTLEEALDEIGWSKEADVPECCGAPIKISAFIGSSYFAECERCGKFIVDVTGPRFSGHGQVELIDQDQVDVVTERRWIAGVDAEYVATTPAPIAGSAIEESVASPVAEDAPTARRLLVFENEGEIDPRMVSTFGVNVKESADAFGVFGTGLKYAVAVLLRLGCEVEMQTGGISVIFFTVPENLRGKEFRTVNMHYGTVRERLGFTTELGRHWEPWMVYRELRCNALDEGGAVLVLHGRPAPTPGKTRFIVSGAPILDAHDARADHFLETAPLVVLGGVEVHDREATGWFYRGVRVCDFPKDKRSRYTYNVTRDIDLTEDRTARHPFMFQFWLPEWLGAIANPEVLKIVLAPGEGYVEFDLDYKGRSVAAPFLKTVGELREWRATGGGDGPPEEMPPSAWELYREHSRKALSETTMAPTPLQSVIVEKGVRLARATGARLGTREVVVTDLMRPGILWTNEGDRVYLAEKTLAEGPRAVARCLVLAAGPSDQDARESYLVELLLALAEGPKF